MTLRNKAFFAFFTILPLTVSSVGIAFFALEKNHSILSILIPIAALCFIILVALSANLSIEYTKASSSSENPVGLFTFFWVIIFCASFGGGVLFWFILNNSADDQSMHFIKLAFGSGVFITLILIASCLYLTTKIGEDKPIVISQSVPHKFL